MFMSHFVQLYTDETYTTLFTYENLPAGVAPDWFQVTDNTFSWYTEADSDIRKYYVKVTSNDYLDRMTEFTFVLDVQKGWCTEWFPEAGDSPAEPLQYLVSDSALLHTPVFSNTHDCLFKYEIATVQVDSSLQTVSNPLPSTPISWVAANKQVRVLTSNGAYDDTYWLITVTATNEKAVPNLSDSYVFVVRILDSCRTGTISAAATSASLTTDVWVQIQPEFTHASISATPECTLSPVYTLTDAPDFITIDETDGVLSLIINPQDIDLVGSYTFTLVATWGTIGRSVETEMTVIITDPCLAETVNVKETQPVPATLTYWIGSSQVDYLITDIFENTYGNCPVTFALTEKSGSTFNPAISKAADDSQVSIFTTDIPTWDQVVLEMVLTATHVQTGNTASVEIVVTLLQWCRNPEIFSDPTTSALSYDINSWEEIGRLVRWTEATSGDCVEEPVYTLTVTLNGEPANIDPVLFTLIESADGNYISVLNDNLAYVEVYTLTINACYGTDCTFANLDSEPFTIEIINTCLFYQFEINANPVVQDFYFETNTATVIFQSVEATFCPYTWSVGFNEAESTTTEPSVTLARREIFGNSVVTYRIIVTDLDPAVHTETLAWTLTWRNTYAPEFSGDATFYLEAKYLCEGLPINAATWDQSTFTVDVFASSAFTFTDATDSTELFCGEISTSYIIYDSEGTEVTLDFVTLEGLSFTVASSVLAQAGDYTIVLRSENIHTFAESESFTFTVRDPCEFATINLQGVDNMSPIIEGDAVSQLIPTYTHSVQEQYGEECGEWTFALADSDRVLETYSWIEISAGNIVAQSDDSSVLSVNNGLYGMFLVVGFADYTGRTPAYDSFNV